MSKWTDDQIISMIRDWVSLYGDPPTIKEWEHHPCYPNPSVVRWRFGSWAKAMVAAGVKNPRKKGCPSHLIQPPFRINGRLAKYGTAQA